MPANRAAKLRPLGRLSAVVHDCNERLLAQERMLVDMRQILADCREGIAMMPLSILRCKRQIISNGRQATQARAASAQRKEAARKEQTHGSD